MKETQIFLWNAKLCKNIFGQSILNARLPGGS